MKEEEKEIISSKEILPKIDWKEVEKLKLSNPIDLFRRKEKSLELTLKFLNK